MSKTVRPDRTGQAPRALARDPLVRHGPGLQFGLQFTIVRGRPGKTHQQRWSSEQYVATAYADGDTSPEGDTAETWCADTMFAQQPWPNMTQIIDQIPNSGPGFAQFASGCQAGWSKTYG